LEVGFTSEHVEFEVLVGYQISGGSYQAVGGRYLEASSKQERDLGVFCIELTSKSLKVGKVESHRRDSLAAWETSYQGKWRM
jgi:hypothetical protein